MTRQSHVLSNEQPFPGLRPFDYGDQEFFFGREQQTGALYGLVDRSSFVAVVGGSGSGKSSLAKAGLLPVLEEENRRSPTRKWTWCEMRPGNAPLAALERALIALADARAGSETNRDIQRQHIHHQLDKTSFGLADAMAELGIAAGERFVLLVDQFEELFRYSSRDSSAQDPQSEATLRSEAKRFVELLLEGKRSTSRDIRILITMRSDFIGDCADFPGLPEAVSASQYLVPALDRTQIEDVIVKPIAKAGAAIEPGLVQQLLADVEGEPDQLPVLQHCLLQLWRYAGAAQAIDPHAKKPAVDPASGDDGPRPADDPRPANDPRPGDGPKPGRMIGAGCYEAVGKISNALNLHADKVLGAFRAGAVEAVFRALSELKDGKAIRRLLPYRSLQAECVVPDQELRKIVHRFRADDCSFLVISPSGSDDISDNTLIYVGHEALLRRWQKISGDPAATGEIRDKRPIGWLRAERRDGQRYQALLTMLDDGKVDDVDRQLKWWNERVRTEQWASRYGGRFDDVEALLGSARKGRRNQHWRIAGLSMIVGVLFVVVVTLLWGQRRQQEAMAEANRVAEQNFVRSTDIAKKFLNDINYALNHGNINLAAATQMESTGEKIVNELGASIQDGVRDGVLSNNAKALKVDFDNVTSDILGRIKPASARERVAEAKKLALQLTQAEPANEDWQYLLFQSEFRHGDILDDEHKAKEALKEFIESEKIIHRLADKYPEDKFPHKGEYHYFLAFITAKIGSALRDDKENNDALVELRAALGFAKELAAHHPDSPEWQAVVPSMISKIGDALFAKSRPDLMGALHGYDAAMVYQRSLLTAFPTDAVINSNFTTTLRNRANVLSEIGQWAEAEAQFDDMVKRREAMLANDMINVTALGQLATDYKTFVKALAHHASSQAPSKPTPDQQRMLAKARELAEKEIAVREKLADIESTKNDRTRLIEAKDTCDRISTQLGDAKPDGHCFGETLAVRLFGPPDSAQSLQLPTD